MSRPLEAPTSLPDPGETPLDFEQEPPEQDPDLNAQERDGEEKSYGSLAGPNNDFAPPTMSELGLKPATSPHRGGETRALATLAELVADKDHVAKFEKPKTAPTDFLPQSTTLLSPHMHFGSLSVRRFYWAVRDIADAHPKAAPNPVNLTSQLVFREMYLAAQAATGAAFSITETNPHVRFIPWHLRSSSSSPRNYDIDSPAAAEWLRRWTSGTTGFPFIDAAMRQLRLEGWIHHLARHAVACFLTRGGCWIAWERGAAVFEAWLIDHETACNAGNWQWLACAAFSSTFYRVYSPIAFPKRWDPHGAFVRRYVPELAKYPDSFIYEPSKAPIAVQRTAGCRVRADGQALDEADAHLSTYPTPMFDFPERRDACIDGMKTAYRVGLHGDDSRIPTGAWKELWPADAMGTAETQSEGQDGEPLPDDVHELPPAESQQEAAEQEGGEEEGTKKSVGKRKRAAPTAAAAKAKEKEASERQKSLDGFVTTKRTRR